MDTQIRNPFCGQVKIIQVMPEGKEIEEMEHTGGTKRLWNCLYDRHYIFFRFLNIFGFLPIRKNKHGIPEFDPCSLVTFYAAGVLITAVSIEFFFTYIVIKNLKEKEFNFEEYLAYGTFLFLPVLQVIPIVSFFEAKKVAAYISNLTDFQKHFEDITKQEFPKKSSKTWVILLATSLGFVASLWLSGRSYYSDLFLRHNLDRALHKAMMHTCSYSITILTAFSMMWVILNGTVTNAAEALLKDIESLRWKMGKSLRGHLCLWMNLHQLCQSLGSVLSWTYLYICAAMFSMSLPSLYVGAVSLTNGDYSQILSSVNTLIFITTLAELAHRTTQKVGSGFQTRLTSLLMGGNATGYEEELIRFIQTVAACPPQISLAGYFNLDRGVNVPVGPNFETRLTELLLSGRAIGCEEELARFCQAVAANPPQISLGGYFNMDRGINVPLYSSIITYLVIIVEFSDEKKSS